MRNSVCENEHQIRPFFETLDVALLGDLGSAAVLRDLIPFPTAKRTLPISEYIIATH